MASCDIKVGSALRPVLAMPGGFPSAFISSTDPFYRSWAPGSLLPARPETDALQGGEPANRRGAGPPPLAPARARPRPAPSRWLPSASRLRLGWEAPRVAKGSGSRERRSLTYFPRQQAHAYCASARRLEAHVESHVPGPPARAMRAGRAERVAGARLSLHA
jgi:hypothetical protein